MTDDLTCQDLVELATAFLDGALDAATEARVVEHLAGCDGCGRYLDQLRRTADTLGDARTGTDPTEDLPADVRTRLLEAFRDSSR